MLAIIVARAKEDAQVKGVVCHVMSILQCADDDIIFMDHEFDQARNMKLLLCTFEQLSGLKINFHKRETFCFGQAKECEA